MGMFINLRVENFVAETAEIDGALTVGGVATLEEGARLAATAVSGVTTLLKDSAGNALLATGTTVPGDVTGYAKGALFIDTDVADGTSGLYVNIGVPSSALFKLVTNAA